MLEWVICLFVGRLVDCVPSSRTQSYEIGLIFAHVRKVITFDTDLESGCRKVCEPSRRSFLFRKANVYMFGMHHRFRIRRARSVVGKSAEFSTWSPLDHRFNSHHFTSVFFYYTSDRRRRHWSAACPGSPATLLWSPNTQTPHPKRKQARTNCFVESYIVLPGI